MNLGLPRFAPCPSERMGELLAGVTAHEGVPVINLSAGESRCPPPEIAAHTLHHCDAGAVVQYPATSGSPTLQGAIADWLQKRFELTGIDPKRHVLPVLGSREALFAIAQVVLDASKTGARVLMPNPGYQIYEETALLAGAIPLYVPSSRPVDWAVSAQEWATVRLVYVCTPGKPDGAVLGLDDWRALFALQTQHGFIIVADESYSEIYAGDDAPLGALRAAELFGIQDYRDLVAISSLSKRSSLLGLRSGYAAGDEKLIAAFWLYRTYHGSAMSPAVQAVSVVAWVDEEHVAARRALYRRKFDAFLTAHPSTGHSRIPAGGFYLWLPVEGDNAKFVRDTYAASGVLLPPSSGFAQISLVDTLENCAAAASTLAVLAAA